MDVDDDNYSLEDLNLELEDDSPNAVARRGRVIAVISGQAPPVNAGLQANVSGRNEEPVLNDLPAPRRAGVEMNADRGANLNADRRDNAVDGIEEVFGNNLQVPARGRGNHVRARIIPYGRDIPGRRGVNAQQRWRGEQAHFNAQARLVNLLYQISNPFRGRGRARPLDQDDYSQ